jgi:hypothetical protein
MSRQTLILFAAVSAVSAACAQTIKPTEPNRALAQVVTPASARSAPVTPPATTMLQPAGEVPHVPLGVLDNLKRTFDGRIQSQYRDSPIDLLCATQAVYLPEYGAVFTTELSPVIAPPITPFHLTISARDKAELHQRKLDRMPVVRQLMEAMLRESANQLNSMPEDQMLVLAVRLDYLPWEDRKDLPNLIVMKAPRRALHAGGEIQTDIQ